MKRQESIWKLDDEKSELSRKIELLKTNEEEYKYLLRTGGILQKYYKLIEGEGDIEDNTPISTILQQPHKSSKLDKKSVLDWFNGNDTISINDDNTTPKNIKFSNRKKPVPKLILII
jgi:hypothetical protein